jgi:stage II sporulation protein D
VSGPTLRARFGLYDTWATFTTIGAKVTPAPPDEPGTPEGGAAAGSPRSLRAAAYSAAAPAPVTAYRKVLTGHVAGARDGDWLRVQRKDRGGWRTAFWTSAKGPNGRFRATLPRAGTYRVTWRGFAGPAVAAR